MSSKSDSNESKDRRVLVLFDFEYSTDEGKVVRMKRGEELVVLKKTNPDWWQCRRYHIQDSERDIDETEKRPTFYAPVCYLKHFDLRPINNKTDMNSNVKNTNSDHKKNVSTIKVGLSFTNPLSSGFSTDDNSEDDHLLNRSNGTLDSSKESLIEDNENCDNCTEIVNKTHIRSHSPSDVVYANLQMISKRGSKQSMPPIPNSKVSPIRILLNHWAEYEDSSGRKFYYNSLSRETSWKPPRRKPYSRDDDLLTSHSEENLTDSSTTSLSTTPNTSLMSDSPTFSPPIPKPKSRMWRKLIKNNNKSDSRNENTSNPTNNESKSVNSCPPPTLPKGWTRKHNEETKELYFINNKTNEKWFCKLDENGRLYFFEENGQESYWELPDLSTNDDSSEERPKIVVSGETPNTEMSGPSSESQSPENQTKSKKMTKLSTSQRSLLERNIKARSMAFLPLNSSLSSRPNIPAILLQEENLALGQEPVIPEYQPPPTCLDDSVDIIKEGALNRTKLIEGGKRMRKNWSNSYLALTHYYLLFFKDHKSAQSGSKPEITIDLTGAVISWCPEKSSRKNCFQVSTIAGQQVLMQEECALACKEWFDLIKNTIIKLPNASICDESDANSFGKLGSKLKRSKSTKQYRKREDFAENDVSSGFVPLSGSQSAHNIPSERRKKIKERLRQFLRRRPTLESLREKGIFKDEPVFGGKLEILCLRDKQSVPKFVQQCVQAIEAKDLTADGLYRACGNLSQVQKLRFQINNDDFAGIWAEDDVHVLTGLLKMFFRDMKEPLFPCDRFDNLMKIIVLSDRKTKLESLTKLVHLLPKQNYDTLRHVLSHLLRVKEHSDQNRMHIQNLAIVFGPTLMWPQNDSNNFALDMMLRMHQNQIIEFLLLEFDSIFL